MSVADMEHGSRTVAPSQVVGRQARKEAGATLKDWITAEQSLAAGLVDFSRLLGQWLGKQRVGVAFAHAYGDVLDEHGFVCKYEQGMLDGDVVVNRPDISVLFREQGVEVTWHLSSARFELESVYLTRVQVAGAE
jgi:hypothetical protein